MLSTTRLPKKTMKMKKRRTSHESSVAAYASYITAAQFSVVITWNVVANAIEKWSKWWRGRSSGGPNLPPRMCIERIATMYRKMSSTSAIDDTWRNDRPIWIRILSNLAKRDDSRGSRDTTFRTRSERNARIEERKVELNSGTPRRMSSTTESRTSVASKQLEASPK